MKILLGLKPIVIRRIGGLEKTPVINPPTSRVIRRIGGLEMRRAAARGKALVIRRIGGLENQLMYAAF